MAIRITGIRKPGGADNSHEAISHYRWVEDGTNKSAISERMTVVNWMEGGVTAYVADGNAKIWCEVRQNSYGTKFLQTVADGQLTNNLLALPEC